MYGIRVVYGYPSLLNPDPALELLVVSIETAHTTQDPARIPLVADAHHRPPIMTDRAGAR